MKSLEGQLTSAKSHVEEFRTLSLSYEQQLQESNETYQQFRSAVGGGWMVGCGIARDRWWVGHS